ncbi:hypothetical protein [Shewanella algae]|uniref:hypothetical protein n=1 Tax=Shewanella algae TaxID=38313 RepID=UPI001AAD098F|nr:hypothetical protein [Shewanella algae]MBO2688772.1 hypothetical protein [Shewanella algae]
MAKSAKEALKHLKNDSKSIWSILWGLINFAWLCYFTFQIKGAEKTAELILNKLFICISVITKGYGENMDTLR